METLRRDYDDEAVEAEDNNEAAAVEADDDELESEAVEEVSDSEGNASEPGLIERLLSWLFGGSEVSVDEDEIDEEELELTDVDAEVF